MNAIKEEYCTASGYVVKPSGRCFRDESNQLHVEVTGELWNEPSFYPSSNLNEIETYEADCSLTYQDRHMQREVTLTGRRTLISECVWVEVKYPDYKWADVPVVSWIPFLSTIRKVPITTLVFVRQSNLVLIEPCTKGE